jgi:hypothetical protein
VARVHVRRLGALACGLALVTCGRRATPADCQLLVDRSVELQLKENNLADAAAIAERERQVRAELDDEIKSCESRRVTEKTMACVRAASSTQELDRCLR